MKRKRIIKAVIIIIIIIAIGIILEFIKQQKIQKTLKQIATFYRCEFIKETNAIERGYSKKLYWHYNTAPVYPEDKETSKKDYYEEVLKAISGTIKENYILIDSANSIEIRIKYNSEEDKFAYLINNDPDYFTNEQNRLIAQLPDYNDKITSVNIKSSELQSTIENDWSRKATEKKYGSKIKNENGYDIYSNGIKVKTVNTKIYNFIFLKEYKGYVFDNITAGMSNEEIRKILGEPTYKNPETSSEIGYKTEKFYFFFIEGQISIYPVENIDEEKNKQFAEIVSEYINAQSKYKDVLDKITNLYPDYTEYVQEETKIDLKYPLKGLEIKMGNGEKSGIYIYNNYNGLILPDAKKSELENKTLKNVYLINFNFVFNEELERMAREFYPENYQF